MTSLILAVKPFLLCEQSQKGIRIDAPTEPFSIVYCLTEKGHDLDDVLSAYRRWGEKWTPSIVHPLPFPKMK